MKNRVDITEKLKKIGNLIVILIMCIIPITLGIVFDESRNSESNEAVQVLILSEPITVSTDTSKKDIRKLAETKSLAQRIQEKEVDNFHTNLEIFPLTRQQALQKEVVNYRIKSITKKVEQDWIDRQYPSTYDIECGGKPGAMKVVQNNKAEIVRVTKVYRYPSYTSETNGTPTYAQYTTDIQCDSLHIEDEQKYSNFKLKEWFTSSGKAPKIEDTEQTETGTEQTETDTLPAEKYTQDELDITYEQLKEQHILNSTGTQDTKLRLSNTDKEIYILYEYEPLVNQVNIITLQYTSKGMKASQSQVSYPLNGILSINESILVLDAEGTTEEIPSLIESWGEVGGGRPLNISEERDTILLYPEVKTVYIHAIEKGLLAETTKDIESSPSSEETEGKEIESEETESKETPANTEASQEVQEQ